MRLAGLFLALAVGATVTPAYAQEQCGAKVTHRYGETRAAFSDVLAGCDKDGACYVSASQIDKSLPANFSHQLRILVKDAAKADEVAHAIAAKAKEVDWLFWTTNHDESTAELPVRGAAKALEWIQCMAKPPAH